MKSAILKMTLVFMVIVISGFTIAETFKVNKEILGEWEYTVPDAPYEYQKGVMILAKDHKELKGEMIIGGYSTPLVDLVNVKYNVKASMDVQGEGVTFDINFDGNTFKGTVDSSEGTMEISGSKKK